MCESGSVKNCRSGKTSIGTFQAKNSGRPEFLRNLQPSCGDELSMTKVQERFKKGVVSRGEYANILRSYQRINNELTNAKREATEGHIAELNTI
jgi:hypothetical protein